MGWNVLGAILAGSIAAFAIIRSRAPGGFYDADVYGMTPAVHRRYAAAFLGFALAFAACAVLRTGTIALWVATLFVLASLFYLTSFLRGASEDDG